MGVLQQHTILSVVGIAFAIAAVAWLQPVTAGGTTFVVVCVVLVVNAFGALFIRLAALLASGPAPRAGQLDAGRRKTKGRG
ncbi:hypothetical protein ACQR1W_13110 [Bradyrhizobium sp. HKCCYLS1011]|uniref:hypothetical protein n=1 Tax=Bradyrhizobium sp. HKCCYLS1011 TaxID=3420733 RepID=UPI003EBC6E94